MDKIIAGVIFLMMLSSTTLAELPTLIPREILFGNPVKASPQISPDGKWIAYIAPREGVLNIWIRSLAGGDDRPLTSDLERGIIHFQWAGDNQKILYMKDVAGDENWRLYSINIETGETRDLTPFDGIQIRVVASHKDYPETLYLAMNRRDARIHDLYRLNIQTGQIDLVMENPGDIGGWMMDADFQLKGTISLKPDGTKTLRLRDNADAPWKEYLTWQLEDSDVSGPIGFSKDGKILFLRDSRGSNTARLIERKIASGKEKVLVEDPEYDIGTVLAHPDTYEIQLVSIPKDRQEHVVMDPDIEDDFNKAKDVHPGEFLLINRDHKDEKWIIGFLSDQGPVPYYLYDRLTKEATFLFFSRPELTDFTLAPMESFQISSRDGLKLRGYLTFPVGVEKKNLPMVLVVHGGPWARDYWGYDAVCQWLANRGYICLQVNFRGSTGFGKDFIKAADGEWGRKMHADLIDTVNWAVEQGYADPKRIAIFGASYGGYAALVGASFTPDVFACAISAVGPSNLVSFIQSIPPYWEMFVTKFYRAIGNPETDHDLLKSRSPLFYVDNIKIPLLIGHGANDPRVKQAESEQMVEALKKRGIPVEYLLFPDEGHGLMRPENRLKFFTHMEKFLSDHIGGRYEG